MIDRRTALSTGLLLASSSPAWAEDSTRNFLVGDTAPYCYLGPGQKPAGVAYEMVLELAKEMPGVQLQPVVAPLVRAFKDLEARGPSLIIPPARIPSREGMLRWVAPLIPVRLMLFTRADSPHDIATLEAARELEIGILSAPGLEEAYRAAGLKKLKLLPNNERALKMLLNDRLAAVLTADCSVYALLKDAGVARERLREGAVLSSVTLWLAASKNYPEAELRQWQAAADKRRAQLAQILARHV